MWLSQLLTLTTSVILRNERHRVVTPEHVHSVISIPALVVLLLWMHCWSTVELMVRSTHSHDFLRVVHGVRHEVLAGIESVDNLLRLRELNHRLLQVVQASLDQNLLLLVEVQQIVPQRLLAEHFRVADDDDAVLGASEGNVQATRIVQEADALVLVGADAGEDDDVLQRDFSLTSTLKGD